jgi:competence protein ComEA
MVRAVAVALFTVALTGCSPSNTGTLQQRTADATAAARRDAEAIGKGVAEGLARKGPVNINSASKDDLARLPGVTPEIASAIIAKRPYNSTRDLLRKRVVTTAEYNRIKNQIVTQ